MLIPNSQLQHYSVERYHALTNFVNRITCSSTYLCAVIAGLEITMSSVRLSYCIPSQNITKPPPKGTLVRSRLLQIFLHALSIHVKIGSGGNRLTLVLFPVIHSPVDMIADKSKYQSTIASGSKRIWIRHTFTFGRLDVMRNIDITYLPDLTLQLNTVHCSLARSVHCPVTLPSTASAIVKRW